MIRIADIMQPVSQRIFEELFTRGMLGSRPLPLPELEAFYKRHAIPNQTDIIVIQVKDLPLEA